jgi:hypothetical protein
MFSNKLTTSSKCPCSGFWSPPSAPWFLRRFSAGFHCSLPWPTHPPSFAPIAGRLLALIRLLVAPASVFSCTLRPQGLVLEITGYFNTTYQLEIRDAVGTAVHSCRQINCRQQRFNLGTRSCVHRTDASRAGHRAGLCLECRGGCAARARRACALAAARPPARPEVPLSVAI